MEVTPASIAASSIVIAALVKLCPALEKIEKLWAPPCAADWRRRRPWMGNYHLNSAIKWNSGPHSLPLTRGGWGLGPPIYTPELNKKFWILPACHWLEEGGVGWAPTFQQSPLCVCLYLSGFMGHFTLYAVTNVLLHGKMHFLCVPFTLKCSLTLRFSLLR